MSHISRASNSYRSKRYVSLTDRRGCLGGCTACDVAKSGRASAAGRRSYRALPWTAHNGSLSLRVRPLVLRHRAPLLRTVEGCLLRQ